MLRPDTDHLVAERIKAAQQALTRNERKSRHTLVTLVTSPLPRRKK